MKTEETKLTPSEFKERMNVIQGHSRYCFMCKHSVYEDIGYWDCDCKRIEIVCKNPMLTVPLNTYDNNVCNAFEDMCQP